PEHGRSAASSPGRGPIVPARRCAPSGRRTLLCALIALATIASGARAQETPGGGAPSTPELAVADSAAPAPAPAASAPPPRLDPGFVAPRLTLGAWLVLHEGGEALEQWGDILRLARDNFMIQIVTATNLLYLLLQSLFLSVLATSLVVVLFNQSRLRHGWMER